MDEGLKEMKIVIAGTRTIVDWILVSSIINNCPFINLITKEVSGCEPNGVDRLGEKWATLHDIPIIRFPPQWKAYGKRAGPIRNKQMAEYADGLIAIWDGKSFGTGGMIKLARKYMQPQFIHVVIAPRDVEVI